MATKTLAQAQADIAALEKQLADARQVVADAKTAELAGHKQKVADMRAKHADDIAAMTKKQKEELEKYAADVGLSLTELGIRAARGNKKAGRSANGTAKPGRPTVPRYRHPTEKDKTYGGGKPASWLKDGGFLKADGTVDVDKLHKLTDAERKPYFTKQAEWDAEYGSSLASKVAGASGKRGSV